MSATANTMAQEIEELEDELDRRDFMLARIQSANQESYPLELVRRLSAGEPPVRVWREFRELTPAELASRAGIGEDIVTALERDEIEPGLRVMGAIARVLDVDLDMLVPPSQDDRDSPAA